MLNRGGHHTCRSSVAEAPTEHSIKEVRNCNKTKDCQRFFYESQMALPYYLSFRLSEVASVHITSDNRDCTAHKLISTSNKPTAMFQHVN
jgi:hypothetical protein